MTSIILINALVIQFMHRLLLKRRTDKSCEDLAITTGQLAKERKERDWEMESHDFPGYEPNLPDETDFEAQYRNICKLFPALSRPEEIVIKVSSRSNSVSKHAGITSHSHKPSPVHLFSFLIWFWFLTKLFGEFLKPQNQTDPKWLEIPDIFWLFSVFLFVCLYLFISLFVCLFICLFVCMCTHSCVSAWVYDVCVSV